MLYMHLIILAAVALVSWLVFAIVWRIDGDWDHPLSLLAAFIGAIALVSLIIGLFPYNPKYWFVYSESGTVETISSRSAGGEKLTSQFALELSGLDDVVISTDPRLLTVKAGDELSLICSWGWVPYGKDRYNCSLAS